MPLREIDHEVLAGLSEAEQEEVRQDLATLQELYEANPLLGYQPHAKQAVFHRARTFIKGFFGGNRSGKTTAGIVDDVIQAVDRDVVPEHLLGFKKFDPPFHCRIICPSESIMEAIVFQKLKEWMPKEQLVGNSWEKAFSKSQRILALKNGSYFDFLTYEQDVDKHGGAAKHRIHFDEEPPKAIWNEAKMRLADYPGADALFTMTPLDGLTWTYDDFWVPWEKKKLKDAMIVTVDIDENPYLDEEQRNKTLEGYSQAELQARKKGRFVHFAGMVYPEFDRHEHVIPVTPIPRGAYVYVAIDPGIRNMAAVVWAYVTYDKEIVVFDELHLQGSTVEQVCQAIQLVNAKHGEGNVPIKPRAYVIDPAARNVVHQTGKSDQAIYAENGIYAVLGQNAVPAGISLVKQHLEKKKLKIMASCPELIDEFRKYRWKPAERSEDDPKDKVVKQDDHLLDALRYLVSHRPYGPAAPTPDRPMTQVEELMAAERRSRAGQGRIRPRVNGVPI